MQVYSNEFMQIITVKKEIFSETTLEFSVGGCTYVIVPLDQMVSFVKQGYLPKYLSTLPYTAYVCF